LLLGAAVDVLSTIARRRAVPDLTRRRSTPR
jgi:hypothetical protein